MNLTGNTILITGGTSGLGFGFAERFLHLGNRVIVCGKRASRKKRSPF
ncbi:MAG: SDR family NAD(P)-dependent oxidoreductase [Desulfobacteraceae bacterium]|nr:SDR family NAD(P)-dependent oxidoreductase [Desulfobacteraceae bacterium]